MRASRLGTYGAAGLGLILALKIALLAARPDLAPWLLIAGHAASRASSVAVIATATYVRDHGAGKPVATGTEGLALAYLTGAAALVPLAAIGSGPALALGLLGLIAGHIAMRRVFEPRLRGYTGDCLGAVQQTSEVGLYLGAVAVF